MDLLRTIPHEPELLARRRDLLRRPTAKRTAEELRYAAGNLVAMAYLDAEVEPFAQRHIRHGFRARIDFVARIRPGEAPCVERRRIESIRPIDGPDIREQRGPPRRTRKDREKSRQRCNQFALPDAC